jgi:hypothetical protein
MVANCLDSCRVAAAIILSIGLLTAESMHTAALPSKEGPTASQGPAAETPAPARTEVEPRGYEITPSPVIEPNPKFFFGAGDGSSGSYDEPQKMNR